MIPERIQVFVYHNDPWWIIHALAPEFVTLAERLEGVPAEIQRWLSVLCAASYEHGIEPFHGYKPAPQKYWRSFEEAEPWIEPFPSLELPKEFGFGPAPVIEARLLRYPPPSRFAPE
ncbi:MAG TPA: hypothetical protein VF789_02140 [Thermoanaerobaculia bacterium]